MGKSYHLGDSKRRKRGNHMNENFSEEDRQYELIFKYAETRRVYKNIAEYRCTNFSKIPEQVFKIKVVWSNYYKCGGHVTPQLRDNSGEAITSFKLEDGTVLKNRYNALPNPYAYFLREYIFLTNIIKQWPENEMITEKNIWYSRAPGSRSTEKQNEFEIQNKIETQMIYSREEVLSSIYVEQKVEDYSFTGFPLIMKNGLFLLFFR